jgi:hypothetical protein
MSSNVAVSLLSDEMPATLAKIGRDVIVREKSHPYAGAPWG